MKDKQKVFWLSGLPASGKSTFSKELVFNSNGKIKRVNKDDIRAMIDYGKWSREREKMVIEIQFQMIETFLKEGYSVVCDNTNFCTKHLDRMKRIISDNTFDVEIEEKFFDVPLLECIERDAKRGSASVGKEVIYRMYAQYLKKDNPSAVGQSRAFIFDIDGTLARMHNRGPYELMKVKDDLLDSSVSSVYRALYMAGHKIIIFSGREAICEQQTKEWLSDNQIKFDHFDMRKIGDNRSDTIVKKEMFDKIKDQYYIIGVFDDREQVVEMWRSIGLTCFQVDWGMF